MRATQQGQGSVISNKELTLPHLTDGFPDSRYSQGASLMGSECARAEPRSLLALAACCVY